MSDEDHVDNIGYSHEDERYRDCGNAGTHNDAADENTLENMVRTVSAKEHREELAKRGSKSITQTPNVLEEEDKSSAKAGEETAHQSSNTIHPISDPDQRRHVLKTFEGLERQCKVLITHATNLKHALSNGTGQGTEGRGLEVDIYQITKRLNTVTEAAGSMGNLRRDGLPFLLFWNKTLMIDGKKDCRNYETKD